MNPHPADDALFDLNAGIRDLRTYLATDGEYCPRDAAIVHRLHAPVIRIEIYRRREDAAQSYSRNGMSEHTIRLFIRAGDKPADMRRHRLRLLHGRDDSEQRA